MFFNKIYIFNLKGKYMTIEDVLRHYGTGYNMNKVIGLAASNVVRWKKFGYVPILTQIRIEQLSNGKLKASLEHGKPIS